MGLADFATIKNKDHAAFPGPGQYTVPSDFDPNSPRGRAATLRGRVDTKPGLVTGTSEQRLGPGDYEIPTTIGKASGGKFTSSCAKRGTDSSETRLGPKYDVETYSMAHNPTTPRFTFGSRPSPRQARDEPATVPTPPARTGSPNPLHANRTGGFSFGIRPAHGGGTDAKALGPGPGAYDVHRFGDHVPKPRPPQHPHVDHEPGHGRNDIPGPGAYDFAQGTIAAEVRPKHPGHVTRGTMPGRNFIPEPRPNPVGPGQYDDPTTLSARLASPRKPGVTMHGRFTEYTDMDDIYPRPAPGDYAIPSCFGSGKGGSVGKGFSFGVRHTVAKPTTNVPGPGSVDPVQYSMAKELEHSKSGYRFNGPVKFADSTKSATTPRRPADDPARTARAAKYLGPDGLPKLPVLDAVVKRAPAFSLGARVKLPEPDTSGPGPGSYDAFKYEARPRGTDFIRAPNTGRG